MSEARTAPVKPANRLEPIRLILEGLAAPIPVIWQKNNGPRPDRPYIAIRVVRDDEIGMADYSPVNVDGQMVVRVQVEASVEVQAYCDDSANVLRQIRLATWRRSFIDQTWPVGWAVVRRGSVVDIGALLDGVAWEDRAVLDMDFRAALQTVDLTSYIETATVSGKLVEGDVTVSGSVTAKDNS